MCGIAGVFGSTAPPQNIPRVLQQMGDAISHRGPDDSNHEVFPLFSAGLVSQRLSLVDVSGGNQPISNEDQTIHVLLNGEIYNHASLRHELQQRGHQFRSRCDTEVIVHLYEELGLGCLARLEGMFAIAILDEGSGELLLARDPAGMKSLYWAITSSGLAFASEVKALLASELIQPQPDLAALRTFTNVGYIPSPRTGFHGIQKLSPGSWLMTGKAGTRQGQFWTPLFADSEWTEDGAADELDRLLNDAVASHRMADVCVGYFVSGGLDSSLLACLAAQQAGKPLKTFSIVFPDDPSADESEYSRVVANHIGASHFEIEFRMQDLLATLPGTIKAVEEPSVRAPYALQYQLAQHASSEVKAVVSGEGADEMFGGYPWFTHRLFDLGESMNGFVPRSLARVLSTQTHGRLKGVVSSLVGKRANRNMPRVVKQDLGPNG